jgi:rhodanese-related sulfurtransferase
MPTLSEQLNKPNCLVLDVRSTGECACGDGYKGAKNIPISELATRVAECGCDKERPIVCYCAAGMRAASAARVLKEHGFTDVISAANAGTLRACKPDH